jgi:hypothetical protein
MVVTDPGVLIWSTDTPDNLPGSGAPTSDRRGWMARLDRASWSVGEVVELPLAPTAAAGFDGCVAIADRASAWVGTVGV